MNTIEIRLGETRILTPLKIYGQFPMVNKSGYSAAVGKLSELSHDEMVSGFQRLDPEKIGTTEDARKWVSKLFRGITLIKHAMEWDEPSVGRAGKSAAIRGQQWRLVMAYSGYEQIDNAVFAKNKKARTNFLSGLSLENRLPGPVLSQRALDRIEERESAADELCDFLGVNEKKQKRFIQWLLGEVADDECNNERSLFIIAQLRHLVAHGALSADRANKLGLAPCFAAAPPILYEVTGFILQTLISKPHNHE